MKTNVEQLIVKAAEAAKSEDAMRFSQAAVNAANALSALTYFEQEAAKLALSKPTGPLNTAPYSEPKRK